MRVLILANGEPPTAALAQKLAAHSDLVMATDGAVHKAVGLGIQPHLVCGDFDSVQLDVARAEFPHAEFVPTPEQNRADLEKAILIAKDRGASDIRVIGALGGRVDHTLTSFALLLRFPIASMPFVSLIGDDYRVFAAAGASGSAGFDLPAVPGETISLISMDGAASVSVSGVKWPLETYRLPVGTQGVSNVATAKRIALRVEGGGILVCFQTAKEKQS